MAGGKTKREAGGSLGPALNQFAQRIQGSAPRAKGGIHVRCTDCDEEYSLEDLGGRARVGQKASPGAPIVRITAPSSVVQDVLEGRLEASQALVRGGVRVRGDLQYLERLLKEAGLLDCE